MKLFSVLAAGVGLAVIAALIAYFGLGAVTRSLAAIGWSGFAAVCAIHLALIAVMGIAWAALLRGSSLWVPVWGRLVRDSGSELLPLSQVGGYVLGARAVALAGVSGTAATASTIVDVTVELFAQLAYTAFALSWLLHFSPEAAIAAPVGIGLAVGGVLAAAFLIVQRRGFALLERFARVLGRGWSAKTAAGAAALHTALADIYRRRSGVWISFLLHLASWFASSLEAWLALQFAEVPLGFSTVLIIESLLYAARSVAFAVPNAVGVQEAVYILLGSNFGLTPEMALALSLLKRGRDFVIGVPALMAWQLVESGRLWRRVAPDTVPQKTSPGRDGRGAAPSAGCDDRAMSIVLIHSQGHNDARG